MSGKLSPETLREGPDARVATTLAGCARIVPTGLGRREGLWRAPACPALPQRIQRRQPAAASGGLSTRREISTTTEALPHRQAGASEPIASRSISDRCQIPDDTFVRRCSGSLPLRNFFAQEQKLSLHPNNPALRPEVQSAPRRRGLGRPKRRHRSIKEHTKCQGTTHEHQPMPGNSASIQRARLASVPSPRSS